MGFGQTYVPIVRELFGKVGRAYEFCAGPGFIGFSLLAAGLCDSLCLSDINREAVEIAMETVRRNNLEDRVSVYVSDALDAVPPHERWDLARIIHENGPTQKPPCGMRRLETVPNPHRRLLLDRR